MSLPPRVRIADQLIRRRGWDDLDRGAVRRLVELARDEALRNRPAFTPHTRRVSILIVASQETVFCGAGLVPLVAAAFGLKGEQRAQASDGASIRNGQNLASLDGVADHAHAAAGVLREFFSRLCGIATHARRFVDALGDGRTRLLDSGSTTPGWHELEKFALACGGAWDGSGSRRIQINAQARDAGDVTASVRRARASAPDAPVEVIVNDPALVAAAVDASPDILRLEGFGVSAIRRATAAVHGRVFVEARGAIALRNLPRLSGLGLDFVSVDGLASEAGLTAIECVEGDGLKR